MEDIKYPSIFDVIKGRLYITDKIIRLLESIAIEIIHNESK